MKGWPKGRASSFKGMKLEQIVGNERAKSIKQKIRDHHKGMTFTGMAKTPELERQRREKFSKSMRANGLSGGYRKGSGRGKQGYYHGYWCDSSWELAWVIYNLEHGIEFQRNTQSFSYMFNGKAHKYYPDFILPDGTFIEIKGWFNEQTRKKIESVPSDIVVLTESDLAPMINYCKDKYGADYCQLYKA